jgi:hypothetical protein
MRCSPPEGGGSEKFYVVVFQELTIYGHTIDAYTQEQFPEDWPLTVELRRADREWGCWHSIACPEGEIGSQDCAHIREITYDTFVQAREAGWPESAEPLTVPYGTPIAAFGTIDEHGKFVWVWNSLEGDKDR